MPKKAVYIIFQTGCSVGNVVIENEDDVIVKHIRQKLFRNRCESTIKSFLLESFRTAQEHLKKVGLKTLPLLTKGSSTAENKSRNLFANEFLIHEK